MLRRIVVLLCLAGATACGAAPVSDTPVVGTAEGARAVEALAPYVRPTPPGSTGTAGYLRLKNPSAQPAALAGAHAEGVDAVELHTHIQEGDTLMMRQVARMELPPGAEAVFEPGGLHLMLIGVREPLAEGGVLPISLEFEGGVVREVNFAVTQSPPPSE